jgi:hypothetical protein
MINLIRSLAVKRVLRPVAATSFLVGVVALMLVPLAEGTPTTKFVSKRYGYSMVLAGGSARYLTIKALSNWSGSGPFPSDPEFDQINDLKKHSLYAVAAKRIPTGWTLRKWTSFTISITVPPCHYKRQTLAKSNLGGAAALVYELKCAEGLVFQSAAIHAHRGYFVIYTADTVDRRAFNAGLRSFHFLGE